MVIIRDERSKAESTPQMDTQTTERWCRVIVTIIVIVTIESSEWDIHPTAQDKMIESRPTGGPRPKTLNSV